MKKYDIGIIGAGVAGAFATLKIAKDYKNIKTVVFDLGRPPMKRRRQLEGWLGCLPNSDGKLYMNDIHKVSTLIENKYVKNSISYFNDVMSNVNDFQITKDKPMSLSMEKKLKKIGYDINLNDYIQIYPKDIHALSKYMNNEIEISKNITFNFDNEVKNVYKQKDMFIITTDNEEYKCKKLIISVGRSGWRWSSDLYSKLNIIDNNDISRYGIRIEMNASSMDDFNKSNCTLTKKDIEIGPFSWSGTIIPEDHVDLVISAFRSNENRWKTDKVSFSLIGNREFFNKGFSQTDRIGKLTFVLSNDRIIKEKVSSILCGKSKISIIPEYDWLKDVLLDLSKAIPEISTKAYFLIPTILPLAPKINIKSNLETDIENMFVVGESAGVTGILSAAIMGIAAAHFSCK